MSSSRGNAGEHLVMAELLMQGFDAYMADRGNPDFDVACGWNATQRMTRLRVKTASDGNAVWTAKKTGLAFAQIQPRDDMVVICDLSKGIRGAEYYIVPTQVIQKALTENHDHYVSQPGRNGKPRKAETNFRVLRFSGQHREDNRSYAYHEKFAEYRNNWELLK
jgi:hypothetical protein